MSKKVVFVPNGDAVYAVPVEVCEQYALEGDALVAAKTALEGESDVEGQGVTWNSRGEAYVLDYDTYEYERAPWYD
ncbi:MAG: hypothetical protein EP339_14350 [Gammaproteobacteria bacterium]|uniref:hypothetical protein n=1 Tax=Marinobacter lipolyticus TaxID=209639 RepID=UPI001E0BEF1D|nr:MAG: hypothetical protein EP339_14350 [Gammaproteobacteria bacterium]